MKDADMPLLDRVEAALARVKNRQGLMRIPVEATDMDVVVSDCRDEITRLRADLATRTAERDALAAEVAALKPQSNADEFASIPLSSWVIEVFHHLCDSPHTPDSWKRDLNNKTQMLLNAIDQGKKGER
jgi:hypothetical protein